MYQTVYKCIGCILKTNVFINILVNNIYMNKENKFMYSFSSLDKYKKCPRAFKYIYIDKEPVLENEGSKKGSVIHNYLEKIMTDANKNKSLSMPIEFAKDYPNILDNFLYLETKRFSKFKDKDLYYDNELEQKIFDYDLNIVGKIDRVYYLFDKENGKVLLDYKTGKVKDIKDNYPQLALYTYMYNKKYPNDPIKYWEIDYVAEKDKYFLEKIDNKLIEARIKEIKEEIETIEKDNTYNCKLSPLCLWCPVLHICPMKQQALTKFKATIEKHNLDMDKIIKDAMEYRELKKGKNTKKELIIYSKVAGTTFSSYNLLLIKEGDKLQLVREKDNKYDPNAVAIYHNNNKIGYIKKELAVDLHIALDNGFEVNCSAENITGKDKGNIGVNIKLHLIK